MHLERLMQGREHNDTPAGRQAGRQMGVSLQMCIPAARGVMELLNEAQQECKQNRVKDGAWGRLRVGREEESVALKLSALFFSLLCSKQVRGHASGARFQLENQG